MCPIRQHTKSLQSLEQSTLLDTWHLFFIMNLKVTSCRSACHPVLVCICMNFITITLSGNSNCLTFFINLMLHISKQTRYLKKKEKLLLNCKTCYFKAEYIVVSYACLFVCLNLSIYLSNIHNIQLFFFYTFLLVWQNTTYIIQFVTIILNNNLNIYILIGTCLCCMYLLYKGRANHLLFQLQNVSNFPWNPAAIFINLPFDWASQIWVPVINMRDSFNEA